VTGADLGFDWRTPRGELKASLFANRMRDMITSRQLSFAEAAFYGAFFGTQWANAGRVKSRGLELEWTHLLTKTLLLRAGYTYTDSEIQESSDPASVGQPLANLPKNKANLGITYDDSKYQATLAARYQSSTFGVQGDPSFFNSNGWGVHLDSFVTFDATASAKLSPGFSVYAQVVNLFDRTYIADNSGFSAPLRGTPRTFFAGVKYKLP
jgi:outer membrane receptor protein involved in Fe transport